MFKNFGEMEKFIQKHNWSNMTQIEKRVVLYILKKFNL